MLKVLRQFTQRMIAGANVATVVVMLLTGFSDRLNPVSHPLLANAGMLFPFFLLLNVAFLFFWLFFKYRYALISFIGLLVAYQPVRTFFPLNIPEKVPEGALKVLSYNVFAFGGGSCSYDSTNVILQYILHQDADIVFLQEVAGQCDPDRDIGRALSRAYPYCEVTSLPDRDQIALLSKYPIVSAAPINFVSRGNLSGAYRVAIGADTVLLVNNHLETMGLSFDDKESFHTMVKGDMQKDTAEQVSKLLIEKVLEASVKRAPQADSVAAYIQSHRGGSTIVCGDFNEGPISYVRRKIGTGLTDCYVSCGNGPGFSYNRYGFFFRIDHVMCSADWEPCRCYVDTEIKVSDHYPVVCWLKKR